MSFVYYDSRSPLFKRPFGACKTGEQVELRLCLPKDAGYTSPRLLLFRADVWDAPQRIPLSLHHMELTANIYACTFSLPSPQLCFYCFEVDQGEVPVRISRINASVGGPADGAAPLWQLTVYDAAYRAPEFLRGGTFYQIFPDRFYFSGERKQNVPGDRALHESWEDMPEYLPNAQGEITNSDYFCGDLRGVTEKLDYLVSLGVTCIYFNPIFEAHASHRYNTADYRSVDPLLGTAEDLAQLCEEGKKRGISVILDGVFSHTGDDSIYFNRRGRYGSQGAYQSKESPYFPWYDFQQWPDKYAAWWGFETLPNVKETNPDYLEFICGPGGVLEFWLSLGVSGFRLDVVDELPDEFLDTLTRCVKQYNPDAVVLGEVWEDASNKIAYGVRRRYFLGSQLDSVMNYPFRDGILQFVRNGDGHVLNEAVLTVLENYPQPVVSVLMNCLSTHDVERAITMLVGEPLQGRSRQWQRDRHFLAPELYARGCTLWRLATVLQFFLPGVPSLYYGDEVGMSGYRDPFNRCPFPWTHMDEALLSFTQQVSGVRARYRALLADAVFTPVCFGKNVYAFTRCNKDEGLFIAVNRGETAEPLLLPEGCELLLGAAENGMLPAYSYVIAAFSN